MNNVFGESAIDKALLNFFFLYSNENDKFNNRKPTHFACLACVLRELSSSATARTHNAPSLDLCRSTEKQVKHFPREKPFNNLFKYVATSGRNNGYGARNTEETIFKQKVER